MLIGRRDSGIMATLIQPASTIPSAHSGMSTLKRSVKLVSLGVLLLALCDTVLAGQVRLKNGMVLSGKLAKLVSLTRLIDPNPGPIPIVNVVLVQTDHQRYFVPYRQIPQDGLDRDMDLIRDVEFSIPQLKTKREGVIQNVGGMNEVLPWNEHGHRTVSLQTSRGPINVTVGITKITPDHVLVTGINYGWDFGLGMSLLPQSTIVTMLSDPKLCDPKDSLARMGRARFYIQAGWFQQADDELAAYAKDFPDLKDKADSLRQGLMQLFGSNVLRELERRRDSGQFQLGDQSAEKLLQSPLGGGVQQDVQRFLLESRQAHDSLVKVKALLGDLQAQLGDAEIARGASAVRSQLLGELDRAGLKRLQPFLQAEGDAQLSPAEKLALAFTGWALGPDAAENNLPNAEHVWEARGLVTEYLRAEDPLHRNQIFEQIRQLESVGPKRLQRLLANLPPVRDAETIQPGVATRIELPARNDRPATAYWVLLPPEYSPNHTYPCLMVLSAQGRTPEQAIAFWGGAADEPGWCQRRGYVVIAPEYVAENAREYTYGAAAHTSVLQTLRDARLRFAIDSDRVFLTGHDMGADAAFDIGLSHPDEFAGVIPIAGVADLYCRFYLENGTQTAWYVVRGELGRDTDSKRPFSTWADKAFAMSKFDLIYCQYNGRGQDTYADELPRIFDWMDLHRRGPPSRDFELRTLRQSDNQIQWVTALDLPKTVVLQAASGDRGGIDLMKITGRINEGNAITVNSPAKHHRIRLIDGVVDFERKVNVSAGHSRFSKFVQPDLLTLLEDFRSHGDRRRIAAAVLEF